MEPTGYLALLVGKLGLQMLGLALDSLRLPGSPTERWEKLETVSRTGLLALLAQPME
jgi:hypothetical protein